MLSCTPQERSLIVFIAVTALGGALFLTCVRLFPVFARVSAFIDCPRTAVRIDVNTADYHALVSVSGIGPLTARRIMRERELHGRFRDLADLKRVKGLSASRVRRLSDHLIIHNE